MDVEYAKTMARYNRWMNEKFYVLSAQLTDEQRKHDNKAFFKSIHGTLNHLLLGDRIWLGRFQGNPDSFSGLDEELFSNFDELREQRSRLDELIEAWANKLNNEVLADELKFTSVGNSKPRRMPMWLAVTHLFNHQTHHRGQVSTLLTQSGLDCGVTDLLWMPDSGQVITD
jgi:uncharacterized damage-inducible protein DinB